MTETPEFTLDQLTGRVPEPPVGSSRTRPAPCIRRSCRLFWPCGPRRRPMESTSWRSRVSGISTASSASGTANSAASAPCRTGPGKPLDALALSPAERVERHPLVVGAAGREPAPLGYGLRRDGRPRHAGRLQAAGRARGIPRRRPLPSPDHTGWMRTCTRSASSGPTPPIAAACHPSPGTCPTRRSRSGRRRRCHVDEPARGAGGRRNRRQRRKCWRRSTATTRTTWSTWMRRRRRHCCRQGSPEGEFPRCSPFGSTPDFLDRAEHQRARGRHGVFDAGEHRRLTPQQAPVLAAQDALQVFEVAVDRLHVRDCGRRRGFPGSDTRG